MINRKIAPKALHQESIEFQSPEIFEWSNGVKVWGINAGSQELVKIDFIFDAGARYQAQRLVAGLTNAYIDKGSKRFSEFDIAEKFDFHGAYLQLVADHDFGNISILTLNKFVDPILDVVGDLLYNPVFPEKNIVAHIEKRKQKFIVDNEKVKTIAHKKFTQVVFGQEHPYSNFNVLSDFDQLNNELFSKHHQEHYLSKDFRIMIAGRYNDEIIRRIERGFGLEICANREQNSMPINRIVQGEKISWVKKENALQSSIRIGRILVSREHPDYFGLHLLNTVLGGYFGSRLMRNIREEKGYTYGIRSSIVSQPLASYFVIGTDVGKDVTNDALTEVYKEIDLLQNELIGDEELALVRNYIQGEMLRSFDGIFAISESIRTLFDFGLSMDYYHQFLYAINKIDAKEILELANKYFRKEDLFEVVAGATDRKL